MKSSRLKGKAMLDLNGRPLIQRLIDRLANSFHKNLLCLCTSTHDDDKILIDLARKNGIDFIAGDELDVMSRFLQVISKYEPSHLVRVTGDNPLTDPDLMKDMISDQIRLGSEYTFCDLTPTGSRSEIISADCLQRIYKELSDPSSSEYMTYMLKRPDKLKVNRFVPENKSIVEPNLSFTVDTKEDFEFMTDIYNYFNSSNMKLDAIIEFCRKHPSYSSRLFEASKTFPKISGIDYSFRGD